MAHILVVEDDHDLADTLADWLLYEGHQVEISCDGNDALQILGRDSFDLILLDWVLPGKSGIEICRTYRMSGGQAPVIMLTGKVSMDNKEIGFNAGADDYLIKPFNLKELSWRMRAWLRRSFGAFPKAMTESPDRQSFSARVCPVCGAMFETTLSVCPDDRTGLEEQTVEFVAGQPLSQNYAILSVIGKGPKSTVFKVWHKSNQKYHAMKILEPTYLKDQTYVKRFQHEGAILKRLEHPNVIAIHDFGISSFGQPFIVMDLVEGRSLARVLNRENQISVRKAISLGSQICAGVAHAHQHRIIHRDLKPANILLEKRANNEDQVRLVDFGISRILDDQCEDQMRLTSSGEIVGTALYMSPEQCLGHQLDARSDIYSLGCVLYEALAGTPPLLGRNVLETLNMQINSAVKPLRKIRNDIPESLDKAIAKAIAKEPDKRFPTMSAFHAALTKCGE